MQGNRKQEYYKNKKYFDILYNLKNKASNSYRLRKILNKSQSVIYRQLEELEKDDLVRKLPTTKLYYITPKGEKIIRLYNTYKRISLQFEKIKDEYNKIIR